jgi:hypothetical protein
MNRQTRVFALTLLIAGAATASWAVIQPVRISLNQTTNAYQVPSGKVLIIEQGYLSTTYNSLILVFSNASSVMQIEVPNWKGQLTAIQPPLKVPGDDYIIALIADINTFVVMFGLLVDPEDLYAAIPSEFKSATRLAGEMNSVLGLASTRQPIIRPETSGDLVDWTKAMNVTVYGTTNPADYRLQLPLGSQREFLRARTISRKSSGGIKRD